MSGLISGIVSGSIAEELALAAGDRLVSINGEAVGDIIDYDFLSADEYLQLEICKADGTIWNYDVEKDCDEDLGMVFSADVFDRIRTCANHCLFCFIDQLQPDPRPSLLVKDDDYRMSFLEGNFITATNLREDDYQRIARLRLSPLYISVHAVDADLRKKLLGFKKDAAIMPVLHRLIDCGCELHTQIVLCPDINDGAALDRTISELSALYPAVASAAVVPVGLTRFQSNPDLRLFSREEAAALIAQIEQHQAACRQRFGDDFVYVADELYIKAGLSFPAAEHYGQFPQIENGIGMAALFLQQWAEEAKQLPAEYFCPKTAILTGVNGAAVLTKVMVDLSCVRGLNIDMKEVANTFYGETVTATGLLTGTCLLNAVQPGEYQSILIADNMLKFDSELFLDNITVEELATKLQTEIVVVGAHAHCLFSAIFGG